MILIGIDIGLSGAVAFIDSAGGACAIEDMPTVPDGERQRLDGRGLADILHRHWPAGEKALAVFEDVRPRPQTNGGARGNTMYSQGSLMRSRGTVEAVLDVVAGDRLRAVVIQPQAWKRFYGLIGEQKGGSREKALALYPAAQPQLRRVKDHNRAEALLIAHFGLKKLA